MRTMTLTLWENQAALENSERAAGKLRREAAGSVDGSVLSVETFEVARELTQIRRSFQLVWVSRWATQISRERALPHRGSRWATQISRDDAPQRRPGR